MPKKVKFKRFKQESAHKQTDGRMDGCYQMYYLPCFAVILLVLPRNCCCCCFCSCWKHLPGALSFQFHSNCIILYLQTHQPRWSRGMIPALGARGPGFKSRTSPAYFFICWIMSTFYKDLEQQASLNAPACFFLPVS